MKKRYIFLVLAFGLFACQNDSSTTPENYTGSLFSEVNSSHTGIDFFNTIAQDARRNVLFYEYMLNGGGVAVADFNQDGLPDIFLTSNTASDKLYINKGNLQFEDITAEAGVDGWRNGSKQSWSTGATIADVNNDGWLDIYVCKSGAYQNPFNKANLLYINNGTKRMKGLKGVTFTESSEQYNVHDAGHSTQAVFFDADKDNDLDLYVMNHSILYKEDMLKIKTQLDDLDFVKRFSGNFYRNEGNKFVRQTRAAGMERYGFGLGLVASDFNHDGNVDVYVANDYSEPDFMFMNNGNGTFTDRVNQNIKHTCYYGMGLDAADINNDGLVDICNLDMAATDNLTAKTSMPSMDPRLFNTLVYFFKHPRQYMFNVLHLNQGKGKFSDIAKLAGIHKTDWSWAVLFADYDNDGHKDMFVTNGYKANFMNNDFITEFTSVKDLWGVISDSEKMDVINRIPQAKGVNMMFRNNGDLTFEKVGKKWGFTQSTFSYGTAYADLDLDGDLDLVINNLDSKAQIYRNNSTNHNYLQIELVDGGKHLPNTCWNAKVTIHTDSGMQYQELTPVRGYQSSVEPILHFGLGDDKSVLSVEVEWLDGTKQSLQNIEANQRLKIDKRKANNQLLNKKTDAPIFTAVTSPGELFSHEENSYDDFENELLLPHKNSMHGPSLAKADVNADGLEDFFIGGASQQAGKLFLQQADGRFLSSSSSPWQKDFACEDMGCTFFDIDNDGDQDLYVVSGGNEFSPTSIYLQDRIYLNDGQGNFSKSNNLLPDFTSSGSAVVSADFNADGWADVFVGGRMQPSAYPLPSASKLLLNQKGKLVESPDFMDADLDKLGIVTAAKAVDFNQDKKIDLVLVGEWMHPHFFKNTGTQLQDITPNNIKNQTGWWSALEAADFDKDGDLDFVAGNLGLNYKYKASPDEPFHIYLYDFDKSGTQDIVLGYYDNQTCYPLRGRECSSQQMPFIKDKFPSYQSFGEATIKDVYGADLDKAYHREATNFATSYIRNDGNGNFEIVALPNEAQISSVNGIVVDDFNKDGILDALIAGNMFDSEVETPRNDAGVGLCLLRDINGNFQAIAPSTSGFFADENVKDLIQIKGKEKNSIIVANNDYYNAIFSW